VLAVALLPLVSSGCCYNSLCSATPAAGCRHIYNTKMRVKSNLLLLQESIFLKMYRYVNKDASKATEQ